MADKPIPTSLLIREFPLDLAEFVLRSSGESVLTRAVLHCLQDYSSLLIRCNSLELKVKDLQCDLDQVFHLWKMESNLVDYRSKVEKILCDPNRFYLHGD